MVTTASSLCFFFSKQQIKSRGNQHDRPTTVNSQTVLNSSGAVVGMADDISAHVSGTGDEQGNPTVVTGSIKAEGIGTEVVSSGIETS